MIEQVWIDNTEIQVVSVGDTGPSGGGDMVLASAQTNTGAKTFLNATMLLRNVSNTFSSVFTSLLTANNTITIPDKSGTMAMLDDISVVGVGGSDFYYDDTDVIPAGVGPQTIPVETLRTIPSVAAESVQSMAVTNQTLLLADAYMDGPIGSTSIPAGQWEFHIFRYVSNTGGVSEIITTMYTNHVETGTIAITGTGTSRTATVTGGTPFLVGDANASMELCSWIQTPNAQMRITGYTSASVATVECLSTYTNEAGVAFSKDKYQFDVTTGDIPDLVVTEQVLAAFHPAIIVSSTDKLVSRLFAKTDSGSAKTISFVYGGTTHYSHFHSPLTARHSNFADLAWVDSGHTGTANSIAGFDALGEAKTMVAGIDYAEPEVGYTVAGLPPTPTLGDRAYVTDATAPTYLGTLTGGGAVKCPVFYNGVAWVSA